MTEWTEHQRKELYYHVYRAHRVGNQYGVASPDLEGSCAAFEDIFSKNYDGETVIGVIKVLIRRKGRIPLPSEIQGVLDES